MTTTREEKNIEESLLLRSKNNIKNDDDIEADYAQTETRTRNKCRKNENGDNDNRENNDENDDGSVNQLAMKTFNKEEYKLWGVAESVAIQNLTLYKNKDETIKQKFCCGRSHDNNKNSKQQETTLKRAPTVASALIGEWLATKIGLGGKEPMSITTSSSINDQSTLEQEQRHVFWNVNMALFPGEMTLILGPSSSGKTTLMRTICQILQGDDEGPSGISKVEGNVLLKGGKIPDGTKTTHKRMVQFVDQGDLSLTSILTVEETFQFALDCADNFVTKKEKEEYIYGC